MFERFEQVTALEPNAQESLLFRGDAVEQVWAAWALGLARGNAAAPLIRDGLGCADHPGTRRHLAVVLAGFGDRKVLDTLARLDPDEAVRATASSLLVRIGPGSRS